NRTHAAVPDEAGHPIDADALSDSGIIGVTGERLGRTLDRRFEEGIGDFVGEQRFNFSPQFIVAAASLNQKSATLSGRAFDRGLEDRFDLLPAVWSHKDSDELKVLSGK